MSWIQTYSRKKLDYLNPRVEDVDWTDVALGLARCDRWRGQTRMRYSSAAHSIHVGELLRSKGPVARLGGLLHDTPEWCLGDWPTPLKMALKEKSPQGFEALRAIECDILLTMLDALGCYPCTVDMAEVYDFIKDFSSLPDELHGACKEADYISMSTEAKDLLPGGVLDNWTDRFPSATAEILSGELPWVTQHYTEELVRDESILWASAWLTHVEDAAGLSMGALVPVEWVAPMFPKHYKHRGWPNRPLCIDGLLVPVRMWGETDVK